MFEHQRLQPSHCLAGREIDSQLVFRNSEGPSTCFFRRTDLIRSATRDDIRYHRQSQHRQFPARWKIEEGWGVTGACVVEARELNVTFFEE
jgi:hypothetical protein